MSTHQRFHGLDAARGLALVLGIFLHATMSFFLSFPARDSSQSTTLAVTFYVIHVFRMSLFYVIAGFFAHMLFHRRGVRAFIRDRAKRILVPMTAGWIVLAPATIAAVVWGLSRTYADGLPEGTDATALAPQGFPLTHLWFLYYLCIFYAGALALRAASVWIDRHDAGRAVMDSVVRGALRSRLAPLALAAPTFAVLSIDPSWALWFGIPTPDVGLAPKAAALVAYGTAFAFGWIMHRQTALLDVLERQWRGNLATAAGLTIACLAIAGPVPSLTDPTAVAGGAAMRLVYAACYSVSVWCWTFGLLGAAIRFCSTESATLRYLSDSSYWLYLVHLPIVFGLQVLLMDAPLHWSMKFPLIVAVTTAVLLVSYHYLVRPTFIGEILNGRKHPRRRRPTATEISGVGAAATPTDIGGVPSTSAAASLAELVNVTKRYGGTAALENVSLAVAPGGLLAVLGPNGAGKSTAIGLWLGTLVPDEGTAHLMGGSPFDVHSRLGVGVMMQEVTLAPMLSAREHIGLASSYYRDPLPVEETLALTGIEAIAHKRYGTLSAGQKRQVQFATAICGQPRLLFLDEPTVGLDVEAREAMWRNVRGLVDAGCSIVLTTHYLEEAEALADRVVVLARGRLIADGSVEEMRSLVERSRITCASTLPVEDVRRWPGVVEAIREKQVIHMTATDAEAVVRRLLGADASVRHLEVRRASLAEAFTELTKEAA